MRRPVLIVEDEALLAYDLSELLQENGYDIVGPAASVAEAMALLDRPSRCDMAILDVNLGRETAEPVAHRLTLEGTPFLVMSAYPRSQHPLIFQGARSLMKPMRPNLLLAELRKLHR